MEGGQQEATLLNAEGGKFLAAVCLRAQSECQQVETKRLWLPLPSEREIKGDMWFSS